MNESVIHVPVLVVGGGPVGLATAIGLRHFGVECLLVERHRSVSSFPKGRAVNVRTMEILDQWGLAERVRAESSPIEPDSFGYLGETLLAPDFRLIGLAEPVDTPWSHQQRLLCPQERVEHALRSAAVERCVDVRLGHRCESVVDRGDAVVARIVDESTGGTTSVVADFVVAADGSRSAVRESLAIGFDGPGPLADSVSILVDAPLGDRIVGRTAMLYGLERPRPGAGFAVVDNDRQWLLMLRRDADEEPPESFTPKRCVELVRAGIGDDSVPVRYLAHQLWQPTVRWARAMSVGRIHLVGDAAHSTTPAGGLGMNCGMADAHNLAWKLAWTLRGDAGPTLLASYDAERRPAAQRTAEASLTIGASMRDPGPRRVPWGVTLGIEYRSSIIETDPSAPDAPVTALYDYAPEGRPGCRAPQAWLPDGSSVLGRFGRGFVVVLAGERPAPSDLRFAGVASVETLAPGEAVRYGITDGFALVRPDGYVAARASVCSDLHAGVRAAVAGATGVAPWSSPRR